MEKRMISELGVPFKGIMCGKLRRYFSFQNFLDFFKVPVGILQSYKIIRRFKPNVVFCKGGYVSFPVAIGAWMARVPVILHESDVVPGLANRMTAIFAKKICVSFGESESYFSRKKVELTGVPIRRDLLHGKARKGRNLTGFEKDLPVVLVMGGSQGAAFLNGLVWNNLKRLLSKYQVAHICGKDNLDASILKGISSDLAVHYKAFEFIGEELKDVYALADIVVTRSGAMTLAELGVMKKPAILVPLGTEGSRGDQIDNAKAYIRHNDAVIMMEEGFITDDFFSNLESLLNPTGKNEKYEDVAVENLSATDKIIGLMEML